MKSKYYFEKMELDGEIIAVPVGDKAQDLHAVLNVNEEAMRIIELLQEDRSEQDVVDMLLQEYDGDVKIIQPLVHAFIDQLRQEGLLEE